ncbi:ACT domain-containing protein [Clostridium cavendishii DSM 21758]|uniref:UPF0237 protein SAMN02745163_00613 n=1 Tax=Clostridium cavendishii DSM 21758 TaxID=1121302 RepID=A0A1M6D1U8_9CLOT|nr:ACT domain-containing protein [Clostridium cavendishii]SHI67265.1 ACT domain-containing protein [Clostridium cavendishii DSM 21758]
MKAVVTVIGKDRVGIIYDVSKILAESDINIINISQTIMDGYFTMIMITEIDNSTKNISEIKDIFDKFSKNSNLDVKVQHEDIFNSMHKI